MLLDGDSVQCVFYRSIYIIWSRSHFDHGVVRDVEHGRGTGVTKGAAAEEAARQTVVALRGF